MRYEECVKVLDLIGYGDTSDYWCCTSCHEDEELGYPLPWIEHEGKEYEVCCRVQGDYHDWLKEQKRNPPAP